MCPYESGALTGLKLTKDVITPAHDPKQKITCKRERFLMPARIYVCASKAQIISDVGSYASDVTRELYFFKNFMLLSLLACEH